jgi:glucose/mannose transport system substrate-binding protein
LQVGLVLGQVFFHGSLIWLYSVRRFVSLRQRDKTKVIKNRLCFKTVNKRKEKSMKKFTSLVAAAAMCLGIAMSTQATELEVTHWWTSGGEAAAVKEFADAFNAGGDTWIDTAIAGSGGVARPIIVSRIIGGDPMGATQLNHGQQAKELIEGGLLLDLTDLAKKEGWFDFVNPSKLLDACTYEGKLYCAPINIHSWQWMWLNRGVFLNNGMKVPKDWHEFVASASKLRAAGIIPLATGDGWQINGMNNVLRIALGGPELFTQVNEKRSLKAAASDEMRTTWQALGDVRKLIDPGYTGRLWNEATSMVITGKAAAQIMGDWAQGEFSVAKQVQGKDYECLPGLGVHGVLDTGGDAFYFPIQKDAAKTAAQLRMASMMMSKSAQVAFNLAKGSLPVRGDIDMSSANGCMQKGLKILANPKNIIENPDISWTRDTQQRVEDLAAEFFSDPNYTVDRVHMKYVQILTED